MSATFPNRALIALAIFLGTNGQPSSAAVEKKQGVGLNEKVKIRYARCSLLGGALSEHQVTVRIQEKGSRISVHSSSQVVDHRELATEMKKMGLKSIKLKDATNNIALPRCLRQAIKGASALLITFDPFLREYTFEGKFGAPHERSLKGWKLSIPVQIVEIKGLEVKLNDDPSKKRPHSLGHSLAAIHSSPLRISRADSWGTLSLSYVPTESASFIQAEIAIGTKILESSTKLICCPHTSSSTASPKEHRRFWQRDRLTAEWLREETTTPRVSPQIR